ncbi:unnamed protein product [Sphenostylis stenocarpa]|uniref:Sugar phosphate transporter domain-containing protein n=1 Tax=Sphenostylis stenocarpa TaxID=92480 RepID=A0AA86VLF4_9FABA|nr:unnamed protein product [Sphenostylis stenocarpa]
MSQCSLSLLASVSVNPKMQTLLSFSHSPSTPHLQNLTTRPKFPPQLHPINALSLPPSPTLPLTASKSSPFLISSPKLSSFRILAASIPDARSDEPTKTTGLVKTLQLGAMLALWYLLNIYFNIYNKQVLKVYPFPATVTAFQFGFVSLVINLIWTFNLHLRPSISGSQLVITLLPMAVAHTLGNLLTNISLCKVAVSFTHTIKAMEPFFTVLLSALFLGQRPTFWVFSSLMPIVGGVALASMTEVSFNWIGFTTAMAANITNQSRNVLSKKMMTSEEETLDTINLYGVTTIISFILLVPFALLVEGVKFSPSYLQYAMVSPVTHSVANSVKRVVIIVSSVIFFQTPVSLVNALGYRYYL